MLVWKMKMKKKIMIKANVSQLRVQSVEEDLLAKVKLNDLAGPVNV